MIGAAVAAALALAAAEPAAPVSDRDIEVSEGYRVYGLPTAEALAAEGYTGIRVFFTNEYGRHQPAVAVLRKGEAAPQVIVWTKGAERGVRMMTGDIRGWDWRVVRLAMDDARASPVLQTETGFRWPKPAPPPAPPPAAPGEEEGEFEIICMDSSSAMIEVIDGGRVTRRERQSCPEDVTFSSADDLIQLASNSIAGCNDLAEVSANGLIGRLLDCSVLAGEDRRSAALLFYQFYHVGFHDPGKAARIEQLFEPGVRLTLPDGSVRTGSDAVRDWFVSEERLHSELGLELTTIAVDDVNARVSGGVFYMPEGLAYYVWAPFEQTWRRDSGFTWRMVSWTVGAYVRKDFKD